MMDLSNTIDKHLMHQDALYYVIFKILRESGISMYTSKILSKRLVLCYAERAFNKNNPKSVHTEYRGVSYRLYDDGRLETEEK